MLAMNEKLLAENPPGSLHHGRYEGFVMSMRMRDILGGFADLDDPAASSMLKRMYQADPRSFADPDVHAETGWLRSRMDARKDLLQRYTSGEDHLRELNGPVFDGRAADPWVFPRPGDKAKLYEADIDPRNNQLKAVPATGGEEKMVRHLYGRDQYYKDIKEGAKHRFEALEKLRRMGADRAYYGKFHKKWKDLYGGVPVYRGQDTPFDPEDEYNDHVMVPNLDFGPSEEDGTQTEEELLEARRREREAIRKAEEEFDREYEDSDI